MNISDKGLALIKGFESLSLKTYKDMAGIATIGYGHRLLLGEIFLDSITEDQADELLQNDLDSVQITLNSLIKVVLTQNQYDALCSFTFNVGCGAFRNSHLLLFLNQGDYDQAAAEFIKWDHCGAVEVPGLLRRRQAEHDLFITI